MAARLVECHRQPGEESMGLEKSRERHLELKLRI